MKVADASTTAVVYRKPKIEDAAAVHALVDECEPLDLNSLYTYLLLCAHFAGTCAVAERDGVVVGFASGYKKPDDASVLFVWQVAVSPRVRGQGIGGEMLKAILRRPHQAAVRHLEATINPSNRASWALFESFAKNLGAGCATQTLFREEDFGAQEHEEERLLRIGPFKLPRGSQ